MQPTKRLSLVTCATVLLASAGIGQNESGNPDAPSIRYLEPPCADGAMAAELATGNGEVILSWLETVETSPELRHALRFSRLLDGTWTTPRTVVEDSNFFANWADFPSVVPGPDHTMLAHWLARSGNERYSYDAALARSTDAGKTWIRIGKLHDDDTKTEHGFVSMAARSDGFDAVWLDGRATATGGPMTLRAAGIDARPTDHVLLDSDVCSCCQTDTARTNAGLVVVYRDHAEGEVRDISIVRRTADGWTEPQPVHDDGWRIAGCPVNGPSVDYADGHLAVAWFTAAGDRPRVQVAFSSDHGETFAAPIIIDDDTPLGRVDVVCTKGGAVVSWLGQADGGAAVRLRHVSVNGGLGAVVPLGATGTARASGFPRLALNRRDLVVAWRDTTSGPKLRTAFVSLSEVAAFSRQR